jgi:hypothetical protein
MGTQNEENKAVIDSTQYQQGNTKELPLIDTTYVIQNVVSHTYVIQDVL